MKWVRNLLIVLALLAVAAIAGGYLLPREVDFQREITIDATPGEVFAYVGDLARWEEWTAWQERDPTVTIEVSDPSTGVGATQRWSSGETRSGTLTVTAWEADRRIAYEMALANAPESGGQAEMTLESTETGTLVRWTFAETLPPQAFAGWLALLFEAALASDFEASLIRLQNAIEAPEATP